ncbi:MAG: hypothetical protein AAFY11_06915 [Cyanobacteria bacterium J06641_5]
MTRPKRLPPTCGKLAASLGKACLAWGKVPEPVENLGKVCREASMPLLSSRAVALHPQGLKLFLLQPL